MENYNKNLFNRFLAGIAVVNVKTHDEYDQFMRTLEKETNLKWMVGQKPTQFDVFTLDRERTCIHRVVSSDTIIFGDISYYDSKGYEIIEFSDLMKMRMIDADELLKKSYSMDFAEDIEQAPTVDTVPVVHAHWITGHRLCETYSGVLYPKKNKHFQYCSKCAAQFDIRDNETERFDYCPECGARMDEEAER